MRKGVRELVEEAHAMVMTHDVADAMDLADDASVVFVDVRDHVEIDTHGKIPGAVHASRGMLEFHLDPASPFHIDVLGSAQRLVFYCAGGGRSILAARTAMEMGCEEVAHIGGGFGAWLEAGGPIEKGNG